jgi:amino acid permease
MSNRALKLSARPRGVLAVPVSASRLRDIGGGLRAGVLVLALSLPQGLLALPVAVAQVGILRGALILLLVGGLNTVTTVWAARALARFFARHGVVPSLPQLAREQLGTRGGMLACLGGATLFFLALLASLVGLARNLADLTGLSAPLWGSGCALLVVIFVLCRTALGTRLLAGLGILNIGLVVGILLLLPQWQIVSAPARPGGSPLTMLGVSLMLFFAPMLLTPVARHLLPQGYASQTLVYGSAAGVAGGTLLFGLWAVAVCGAAGAGVLAEAKGTAIPALLLAVPSLRLPGLLLGLLLLGMTALRCALVLSGLAEEQLPERAGRPSRRLFAQLPAGLAMALALGLLLADTTSFTQLIALAGGSAASLTSLVIPTLLARAGSAAASGRARPGRARHRTAASATLRRAIVAARCATARSRR